MDENTSGDPMSLLKWTMNWKGKPLVSFETMIKLISGMKTKKGLMVASRLDEKEYTKGIKKKSN